MDNFNKVLQVTSDEKVELAQSMKDLLNKELCLGMTRYVCRNGSLGEGHEHFGPFRYYQALREMWNRGNELKRQQGNAMNAQADLLDAKEVLKSAKTPQEKLRAQAKATFAETQLLEALVNAEDTLRQLDEFNKVRLELQNEVRAKYPGGIEQAEEDHWRTVAEYRSLRERTPYRERMENIPLAAEEKSKLGISMGRNDMLLHHIIEHKEKYEAIPNDDVKQIQDFFQNYSKVS